MLFNSIEFLIFFLVVSVIYYLLPRRIRHIWLLLASYCFYMNWNKKYGILLAGVTVYSWMIALVMDKANGIWRKLCLTFGIVGMISILTVFKYLNFLTGNANRLLNLIGIQKSIRLYDIVLPVGISFFIFQAMGYIIDVYRKEVEAEKNILIYALFVSFFPQLVAGPIERSKNLLFQLKNSHRIQADYARITKGMIYMLYGFFVKMVIADRVAIMVDRIWADWELYGGVELLIAAIGFSIQIYGDFAGYSAIAIGAAEVLGFTLMENFCAPYLAFSIKDFWRRWHISLSSWFRDYVYIPLGGSRCSTRRKYCNLMVTFLVSGLWHGANWTYVMWGGLHGLLQITEDATSRARKKIAPWLGIKTDSSMAKLGKVILTFLLVTCCWIFFRSDTITDAVGFIQNIVRLWDPWVLADGSFYTWAFTSYEWNILLVSLIVLFLFDYIRSQKHMRIDQFLMEQGALGKGIVICFLFFLIFAYGIYGGYDESQFIYFQF